MRGKMAPYNQDTKKRGSHLLPQLERNLSTQLPSQGVSTNKRITTAIEPCSARYRANKSCVDNIVILGITTEQLIEWNTPYYHHT